MSSPVALTQTSLVSDALAHLPMLVRQVQDGIHDTINGSSQHRQLLEPWQRHRLRFIEHFEQALTPLLAAAVRGEDPLPRRVARSLDELSLVDESQALHDVSLAQVIQAVEDGSRNELYQLGNFFAALHGTARARQDDNPLRPAVFGRALQKALSWPELNAEGHYALMRVAAQPLAQALQPLYASLCAQLRAADLTPLVAGRGSAAASADHERLRRASSAYETLGSKGSQHTQAQAATLDGLARRVDAYNSRPMPLGPAGFATGGQDLLTRLYDQILADPRLLPPVKALLARLQVVVVRLAAADPSLLRRQDHPTWKLLNRVGNHGTAFERADDPRLQDFLRFMQAGVDEVAALPRPGAAQFQDLLDRVEAFISQQARQGGERSSVKLASLERERQRDGWLQVLREQIRHQLAESPEARASALLRDFLRKDWTRVIVQSMVEHGRDAPQAQAHVELVDTLLSSLRPLRNEAERQALRTLLPVLVQALDEGCESIALPAAQRKAVMDELMRLHGRLLLGPTGQPQAPEPQHVPPLDPEAQLQALLSERESMQGSRWAHDAVDRSRLPTVPLGLYSLADAAASRQAMNEWVEGLTIGRWYHLFVQSQWITAQLAWVSDSRQYFLFVGQDDEERHSLTRGALEHLLRHGMITSLEDEGDMVQRAVSTLMQDLDSSSPA